MHSCCAFLARFGVRSIAWYGGRGGVKTDGCVNVAIAGARRVEYQKGLYCWSSGGSILVGGVVFIARLRRCCRGASGGSVSDAADLVVVALNQPLSRPSSCLDRLYCFS